MSSKSKLNPTNLILDDIGNIITITSIGSNTLDLEGTSSSDISLTGINNITSSGTFSGLTFIGNSFDNSGILHTINVSGEVNTETNFTYNDGTQTLEVDNLNINSDILVGTKVILVSDSAGGVVVSTTPATLLFNTVSINDTGYSLSSGEITISDTGLYEISYTVVTDSDGVTGADRGRLQAFLELDSNTGSFSTVTGSTTSGYLREQNPNITSYFVGKSVIVNVTAANSIVRLRYFNSTTNTTATTTSSNQSLMYIIKLR